MKKRKTGFIYKTFLMVFFLIISFGCITVFAVYENNTQAIQEQPQVNSLSDSRNFKIDTVHSCALFRVQHMGAGLFWGRFNDVTGSIVYDKAESVLEFDVSIAIDSVDSGHSGLDGHLKSPDFFNSKENPSMTFKSLDVKKTSPKTFEVNGLLTMRGVSKPIAARVVQTGMADKGRGLRVGFEAEFVVNRSEFGVDYGVKNESLGDETRVIVGLEAIEVKTVSE